MEDYDVVVVGGGPAGIGAAFSAAKLGLKTAILERHFMLGGNWTNGYVLSILGMYTYDGKEKIVGGVADEVVKWLEDYRGTAGKVGNFVPSITTDTRSAFFFENSITLAASILPILKGNVAS